MAAAEARARLHQGRARARRSRCWTTRVVSPRDFDQRTNAYREADANLRAAKAALQTAQLNLGYTEVRAPVAGRVGRLEITVGNLVAAGPGAPVLTTLVSVSPIYASFDADEQVVARALQQPSVAMRAAAAQIERIPVQMATAGAATASRSTAALQLIDNQVDATQRHGARARRVRQPGRRADARPVRAPAHGGRQGRRRCWRQRARRSAPTRTRSS